MASAFTGSAAATARAKDSGRIFVSNEKSNNLLVLDPKTDKIVKEIRTARRPRVVHFSADRTQLYVACGDEEAIESVDVA
jgi:YVTN family beta-propeller protein